MKLSGLVFLTLSFEIFVILYAHSTQQIQADVPTFDIPEYQQATIGECNWWVLCTNALVDVMFMIGVAVVWVAQLILEIFSFATDCVVYVLQLTLQGIDGAPWWVNIMLFTPLGFTVAIIIYRMVRKGDSSDES